MAPDELPEDPALFPEQVTLVSVCVVLRSHVARAYCRLLGGVRAEVLEPRFPYELPGVPGTVGIYGAVEILARLGDGNLKLGPPRQLPKSSRYRYPGMEHLNRCSL